MELKAKIVDKLPMESGKSLSTGKEWKKASIIVEYGEKYPKKVKISALKNAEELDALAVGSEVVFYLDIESREYNGRWYTDVNCYNFVVNGQPQSTTAPKTAPEPPVTAQKVESKALFTNENKAPDEEDLPF